MGLSTHDRPCDAQKPFDPRNMHLAIVLVLVVSSTAQEKTMFGKLKSGFQLAGKLLGVDETNGVAQLVSEAFGKAQPKGDGSESPGNIFSGFLRVLGFDAKKLGAIAVNAIIFVAQLISSSLSRPADARDTRGGSPLDWLMSTPEVINLFAYIKDQELSNHIVMYIKERSLDEDTDCVQLLLCKSAPFIRGMQRILDGNSTILGRKSLYAYLPSLDDVIEHSDLCDKQHPFCFVHQ